VDQALLRRAREIELRCKLSWWDSMIVAAAQLQDCVLLLTEDLQDGAAFGALTVRSPFTLQVSEAAATYAVERRGPGLHRPRGRPKGGRRRRPPEAPMPDVHALRIAAFREVRRLADLDGDLTGARSSRRKKFARRAALDATTG
jgi:hypothetical protein